ncbi:MAG: undecaprenyldiphospho-muramoylpentapeptide beta-N-acetylglucosaminyltransferase [Alphaproteobacteria bacterium]|nr:undecaprenyldiphospho-muramoylpentapeptide beta-N-acetylglucosaminyltransferase [Alphaproteobacteria bacterium]MCL2505361.1 undecaprenyldiphospho-muramoylpentapeptide beta-N-acetylglucosaminyltransferase [Alphaproteobacteria bacterium]
MSNDNEKQLCVVLAAGGTGGHIFPAEALARELVGRGVKVALLTDKRGTNFSKDLSVDVYRIKASSFGYGFWGKIRSIIQMGLGVIQAALRLTKIAPDAVVGFGGYPSVPTVYAAAKMGIPILLHDQNAIIGRANQAMLGYAGVLATSFPTVSGVHAEDEYKLQYTGNPVRPAFTALRARPYPMIQDDESVIKILVLGGSQGARVFSRTVPAAIALLPDKIKRRIVIAQQCRPEDIEAARYAFAAAGIDAELSAFFNDVPERMADYHLVICRAGGSTVAELSTIGRPSILVPFPHGHAGEQMANASFLAQNGAAWIIPDAAFTPEALVVRLESVISNPESLAKAAASARASAKVMAVDALADAVVNLKSGISR